MKANELRIGNYINDRTILYYKTGIIRAIFVPDVLLSDPTTDEEWQPDIDVCDPIPLSEEWLIKFGFKKKAGLHGYRWENKGIRIGQAGKTFFIPFGIDEIKEAHINLVHQLQNIVHALTGEELTIKE